MNEHYEFKQDLARQRREYVMAETGLSLDEVMDLEQQADRYEQAEPLDRIADALERIALALESKPTTHYINAVRAAADLL